MTFQFQNGSIHYEVYGNGPAIVLLHGFLESSAMWSPLIPLLSDTHTVITMDFPGMGESEQIAEVHSMQLMAEVVNALLQYLEIEKATLIGHSMGGYVSLAFAELFEDKLEKMILLNSTYRADSSERQKDRDRAIRLMGERPRAFISMAISNWATTGSQEIFKEDIEAYKTIAYDFPVDGIIAALKGMKERKDTLEVLKNFPGPKYLLLAENDPIIPAIETYNEATKAGVTTKIIDGGHMSMIENKEALLEFVQRAIAD